jgi:hypothetical protein
VTREAGEVSTAFLPQEQNTTSVVLKIKSSLMGM